MTTDAPPTDCVLQLRQVSKSFPGVTALANVQLDIIKGQVHALMGENGAGKSTLMKIVSGLYTADVGEILFKGRRVQFKNPHEALRAGIAMIHQELLLFPDLTVAENICMGQEPTRTAFGWLDKSAMNERATALLKRLGVTLSPTIKTKTLSVAEKQTVEIAKALAYNAEVIIMDEPTSAISGREVEALFGVIRDLKQRGVAVIYISHKMDEIFSIADMVTVLRDGRYVTTQAIGELTESKLIALTVGRELVPTVGGRASPRAAADVALEVRGLTKPGKFRDVSFTVRRGEILGIAGLMGAGRSDVVNAIYGLTPANAGEIRVNGRNVRIASPRDAITNGIALVSEDRREFGFVPKMSVKHNVTLASLSGGFINHRAENGIADAQIAAYAIKTPDRNRAVVNLSGGNQQKVVIAKALLTNPNVLILDEPTRGIDIGAKAEVYALIARLARDGKAIIMVSSELAEILSLSDRILVMREGAITAELDPRRTSQEEIMTQAMPD